MATTIAGSFGTRREAELVVERLVQEHGLERTDVFVEPETASNSAGTTVAGADAESGIPGVEKEGEPKLAGRIKVSVDLNDDGAAEKVLGAFRELGGTNVTKS